MVSVIFAFMQANPGTRIWFALMYGTSAYVFDKTLRLASEALKISDIEVSLFSWALFAFLLVGSVLEWIYVS